MVPQEKKCEQEARKRKIEEYKKKQAENGEQPVEMDVDNVNNEDVRQKYRNNSYVYKNY